MHRPTLTALLLLSSLSASLACSGLDKEMASLEIRKRFCNRWPYGCSDSTRVVVKKVRKANEGRLVDFRIIDGDDATGVLSAAYFEEGDGGWQFFSFDNPFRELFDRHTNEMNEDRKRVSDVLLDLKAKQNWYRAIYGRYAPSFEQLASRVRYTQSYDDVRMTVAPDGDSWEGAAVGQFFTCGLDPSRQLPKCQLRPQGVASGEPRGLGKAFGAD